jgi:hypothetical protein
MTTYGGEDVHVPAHLTSALDEGDWIASPAGKMAPSPPERIGKEAGCALELA